MVFTKNFEKEILIKVKQDVTNVQDPRNCRTQFRIVRTLEFYKF